MNWPFADIRPLSAGVILADPPWRFDNWGKATSPKSPQAQYACMGMDDLRALPVGHLAAPDCALFMWATAPLLLDAIDLMAAWGFTYKTAGAWAKQSSTGAAWAFGTGYCLRSAAEFFLLGTIGQPRVKSRSVRNLIVAPVRQHSRKPPDLHRMAAELYEGPHIELFARAPRDGWQVWGNETNKYEEDEP